METSWRSRRLEHNIEKYHEARACEDADRFEVSPDEVLMAVIS
jgi:hypothetical protein